MKIAIIVNPSIPVPPEKYGGIERIVYMLIQGLCKRGHSVTLFASNLSKPKTTLVSYSEHNPYNLIDLVSINLLTAGIAFQNFDIVHTFGRMQNIGLLMLSKIPKIVSYQLPPTVSQVKKAIKIARKGSIHFTGCSDFITRQISSFSDVKTIYNGIDITTYNYKSSAGLNAPLVFLGRIQEEKGTAIAIQVALDSGRNLIIAGNIPAEQQHQNYFNERVKPFIDQKQITYIGPVNDQEKDELLGKAAALLMPVTWDEPFGIVMAESLACGTPVIGFKKGALPEVIIDKVNGFLVDSIADMSASVASIVHINRNKCRQIAESRFSSDIICSQYEQLYNSAIDTF